MRAIKLMPDYQCWPLWEASPGVVGNIDPESLRISPALRLRLSAWADVFDATLNLDDPATSGFATHERREEFDHEGRDIARALREELGSGFVVVVQL